MTAYEIITVIIGIHATEISFVGMLIALLNFFEKK